MSGFIDFIENELTLDIPIESLSSSGKGPFIKQYIEVEKFPKATSITAFNDNKSFRDKIVGEYSLFAEGEHTIHGITNNREVPMEVFFWPKWCFVKALLNAMTGTMALSF